MKKHRHSNEFKVAAPELGLGGRIFAEMAGRSASSQVIEHVVRCVHRRLLRALGYHKVGRSFYLQTADPYSRVINFQSGMWNTPEDARFTINLNVALPFFYGDAP
ncbi:MAG: DUF4304 domain-containing protein [bacterium]